MIEYILGGIGVAALGFGALGFGWGVSVYNTLKTIKQDVLGQLAR